MSDTPDGPPRHGFGEGALPRAIEAATAAAYWVATADDALSDEEFQGILDALGAHLGDALDADDLADLVDRWDESLDEDEAGFLQALADALADPPERRRAFELACAVAGVDGELGDDEAVALGELAGLFGITEPEAEGIAHDALLRLTR